MTDFVFGEGLVVNVPRYVLAGGVSLAIHAALMFVAQESKVFAMPAGAESTTVSLNFTPQQIPSTQREETVTEPVEPEPIQEPEITETPPKPVEPVAPPVTEPKKVKPKKEAITNKPKPKPKKEIVKKPPEPKKPVVEKKVEKKVVEKKPEPVKKTTQPEDKKVAEKKTEASENQKAQPKAVNQGVTASEPVLVTKPTFSARPTPPKYPRQARRRGVEGVATYEIWLDEDGKQVKQALVTSSGALLLDKAALDAIKKWKFSPHKVNGQAIAHRVRVPVRFNLD